MPVEEKLDEFIKQYKVDRKEDERKSNFDKYQNYAYIAWGFTLATLALATSGSTGTTMWGSIVATIIFLLLGWFQWFRSMKWRK